MGVRGWYLRRRNTIAFLILAVGTALALWRVEDNGEQDRQRDRKQSQNADIQLCVAFDVLKANLLASLLTHERDFPPPGREEEYSRSIRGLAGQIQIVDCSKLVGGEELEIVVTIPPPPTTGG